MELNLNLVLVWLDKKPIKLPQPQSRTPTEAQALKEKSSQTPPKDLTIRDVLVSLIVKYKQETDEAFGGGLRKFSASMLEKVSSAEDTIEIDEKELENIIKLLDIYGYDNIVYRNLTR